ncbi:MAG: ECF transporter S component [bacterium]|nr:ECF transporter S component [bacterium]
MQTEKKDWLKFTVGFIACLFFRLIPFRVPNIEPILAVQMPFSRIYGGVAGFSFAFFSIVVYDFFTSGLGMWTLITAVVYGSMGLWAVHYFKNKKNNSFEYVKFAIMSTIAFDAITGLSVGPLFFHQSFFTALVGQIPFTVLHLIGNSAFALILSPSIYNFILKKEKNRTLLQNDLNFTCPVTNSANGA